MSVGPKQHYGRVLLLRLLAYHAWLSRMVAAAEPHTTLDPVKVVAMIMGTPQRFKWRDVIRQSLEELTSGVSAVGRPVKIVTRFAMGYPCKASIPPGERGRIRGRLRKEQDLYGDLAMLNISDGMPGMKGDTGKIWHLFAWAVRHFPRAHLYCKQDDDAIINWHAALPMVLKNVVPEHPASLPMRRLYVGRLCPPEICPRRELMYIKQLWRHDASNLSLAQRCAAGTFVGLSHDVAHWSVRHARAIPGLEDLMVCSWAREFERRHGLLDGGGIVAGSGEWVHPVRDKATYMQCIYEGCTVVDIDTQEFKPPARRRGGA